MVLDELVNIDAFFKCGFDDGSVDAFALISDFQGVGPIGSHASGWRFDISDGFWIRFPFGLLVAFHPGFPIHISENVFGFLCILFPGS